MGLPHDPFEGSSNLSEVSEHILLYIYVFCFLLPVVQPTMAAGRQESREGCKG